MEYKTQQDICFVPFQSKVAKKEHLSSKEQPINNVLIELGPCKVYVPEHVAVPILTSVFKEVVDFHV